MTSQVSSWIHSPARGLQFGKLPQLLIALSFVGIALLLSLMIAIGQFVPALVLFGLVVVPVFVFLTINLSGSQHDAIFWVLLTTVLLSSFLSAITRKPFAFMSTGVLLAAAPLIVYSVICRCDWRVGNIYFAAICLAFFVFGIACSYTGRSRTLPAAYTAIMSLKPYLLVGFGAALVWSNRTQKNFYWLVRWAWAPLLFVALIQWFAPSLYLALLADVESIPENNPFFPGFPRATAVFQQPSILAAFSCMFGLIAVIDAMLVGRIWRIWPCFFYLILVIMTGQRQEFLAALVSVPLAYVMIRWRPSLPVLGTVATCALMLSVGLIAIAAPDMMAHELRNWGVDGPGDPGSARAILYSDAVKLANQYWPMGTGFGTFGSVGSVKFDQSLFQEMGYGSFWWFSSQSYLMDSYWAKYIAETGWVGFILQLMFYAMVLKAVADWVRSDMVRSDPETFRLCMFAFVGLCFVLLTSPTAFTPSEPHGGMIPLMFVGIAWQYVNRLGLQRVRTA